MFSLSHKNEGKLCCLVNRCPQTGNITVDTPATPSSSTLATNVAGLLAEGVWGPVRPGAWDAVGQEEGRAHLTSYVATKTGRDIHLQSSYLPPPPSQQ